MAAYMEKTGELLRTKQGKGAKHNSLLDHPSVCRKLEEWFKGELPVEQGGFIGPVHTNSINLCDI